MYIDPTNVAFFTPPIKECERETECRFQQIGPIYGSALMYYDPIFDKDSQNKNPDVNTNYRIVVCRTCNRKWQYKAQYNKIDLTEIT